MKKRIIVLAIVLYPIFSFTQNASRPNKKKGDRLFYLASIDFVMPQKKEYSYAIGHVGYWGEELPNQGFLLTSFGVTASVNYFLFRALSIGLETGFQTQTKPDFSFFKLGGMLRYFADRDREINLFLGVVVDFSLDRSEFKEGSTLRFGFGFPVKRFSDGKRINLNLFREITSFDLSNSKPLLGIEGEKPDGLTFRSYGLSAEFKW